MKGIVKEIDTSIWIALVMTTLFKEMRIMENVIHKTEMGEGKVVKLVRTFLN